MRHFPFCTLDFDFNAICEPDSEWVATYGHIKAGIENPLFMIFDFLDYKWLRWMFRGRQQQHDALDRLTAMLEALVNERRNVITKQVEQGDDDVHRKDLLSMMLHAQLQDASQDVHLSTDELIVSMSKSLRTRENRKGELTRFFSFTVG